MSKLSVVIPCYNEEKNIPLIIQRITSITDNYDNLEILLVNNGSTDNSAQVFEEELKNLDLKFIKVVNVEKNQGYGFGILSGLKEATGDFLAWTHADMQTDPADVLVAFEKLKGHPDPDKAIVKGRRLKRNILDAFFTFGMSLVTLYTLKMWLSDINAQPKLFSRKFYEQMENPPYNFSLDLYVLFLAKQKGYQLLTVPVYYKKRLHGEAKGGGSLATKWPLIKRTFAYIFELKRDLNKAK